MTILPCEDALTIRPMRIEDLEQVQSIDRISFTMPWPDSAYNYELKENPHSLLWVAEVCSSDEQPSVIGMIVVWLIQDEAHIATIAVHPRYRSRGIAQRLLISALKEAIQKGAISATLEVRAYNIIAQRLYHRFRFAIVGDRPRYYRDNNEDALIMTVNGLDPTYLEWLESGAWKNSDDARSSDTGDIYEP
jgi:ribosomal-protein-alanine N-acetyltransferase